MIKSVSPGTTGSTPSDRRNFSSGLEKNPGFSLTLPFVRKAVYAMMYGDIIVNVANQVRPYEVEAGAADAMIDRWSQQLPHDPHPDFGLSRHGDGGKISTDGVKIGPHQGYLGDGNKMGEGWLLTAEMLELIHSGTPNIVCTQPFGDDEVGEPRHHRLGPLAEKELLQIVVPQW